jgi:hypothetical protein
VGEAVPVRELLGGCMNLIFLDPRDWDYDVSCPFERPLGGTESALCYLVIELARRGHRVTLLTGTTRPREVRGVSCLSSRSVPAGLLRQPLDAFVVACGPAEVCLQLHPQLAPATPLVLWTGHAPDQPMLQALQTSDVRNGWDVIVAVSDWHRQALVGRFALDPARVFVLHNAIAPAFAGLFPSAGELVAVKERRPVLAYTSTPFRGLDLLLRVFPEVQRRPRPSSASTRACRSTARTPGRINSVPCTSSAAARRGWSTSVPCRSRNWPTP